ncbi:MAG: hypothetical protein HQM00_12565 [Magnetococcales bacterium]|nr:hypothetical protein [Magnetococcales bacterium]
MNAWMFCAGIGAALFGSVVLTWQQPWLTTPLLIVILLIQARFHPHPNDRRAMIWAAALGTPAEAVSVHLGEWTYHAPHLMAGLPLWIPLIWANLFPLYRRLVRTIQTALPASESLRSGLTILLALVVTLYAFATLSLMHKTPLVYLLYAGFLIVMAGYWRSETDLLLFVVGASLGTLGEFTCVQLGYWHYYQPYFRSWGVDITLAMDWGLSTVIIHRLAERSRRGDS